MRLSVIRYATHLGNQYKVHWQIKRRKKVAPTLAESVLSSLNIKIEDPNSVVRPSVIEERCQVDTIVTEKPSKPPIYVIGNLFSPIEKVEQSQLLTNSVVFDQLPEQTLNQVEELTNEDKIFLENAIVKAYLLDAQQDRLPIKLDVINEPGYKPGHGYGPKAHRIIKNLMHQLILHNNYRLPYDAFKSILHNVLNRADVMHSGRPLHFRFRENFFLCSRSPMPPVLDENAVKVGAGASMPDISPFNPFVHVVERDDYPDVIRRYCIPGASFAPHTILLDFKTVVGVWNPEQFTAKALLRAFGNTAAYARELYPEATGDLEKPVTINLIHTTGNEIQFCKYQLNTLDLTGPTKNYFWYTPMEKLYSSVAFDAAAPTVKDLNHGPMATLNALISNR